MNEHLDLESCIIEHDPNMWLKCVLTAMMVLTQPGGGLSAVSEGWIGKTLQPRTSLSLRNGRAYRTYKCTIDQYEVVLDMEDDVCVKMEVKNEQMSRSVW